MMSSKFSILFAIDVFADVICVMNSIFLLYVLF